MKMTGISFLAPVFALLALSRVEAQPSVHFVAPMMTVEPGSYFTAQIRVAGFRKIVGAQYSMNWDPAVLRFDGIMNPALNMTVNENFGLMGTELGLLTFSWYDPTLMGMTLPDSAVLYAIRFQALGAPNSSSALAFSNMPTATEVVDTTFTAINAGFHNSTISILAPNSVSDIASADLVQISDGLPNPFRERTAFSIELNKAADLEWAVFDLSGRKLFSREGRFGPGKHTLELQADALWEPGAYYCRFFLEDGSSISRKLIKI